MAHNSLSEGFIRFTYTGITVPHHAVLPINFNGTPTAGTEPSLTTKGGGSISASDGLTAYITEYLKGFSDETIFTLAEIYAVDAETEERQFIYAWNIGLNGDNANGNIEWAMYVMTFKTINGGTLKLYAMESVLTPNLNVEPPYGGFTFLQDLSQYVLSEDSIVIGRDNGIPFAAIRTKSKFSDALRKSGGG